MHKFDLSLSTMVGLATFEVSAAENETDRETIRRMGTHAMPSKLNHDARVRSKAARKARRKNRK
jgi:hypothetical protein